MKRWPALLATLALLLCSPLALAYIEYPTPAGPTVLGTFETCANGAGLAVPCPATQHNSIALTPTVQNSAYALGNAMGGLQTFAFFRGTALPSGALDQFAVYSKGGSAVALSVFIFDANPSASTCTDKVAFALNAADVAKLATAAFVITPAAIAGSTVSSVVKQLTASVKNSDGTTSVNLYACVVAGGAVTPATTTDLVFMISGTVD